MIWFAKYGGWIVAAMLTAVLYGYYLVYEYRERQLHAMRQRHDSGNGPYRTAAFNPVQDAAPVPPMPNPIMAMWCAFRGHKLGPAHGKRVDGEAGYSETTTRYCLRCGHRERKTLVVGYCPTCEAGPNEPCDPALHG